jgi:hypothetical protein
MMHFSALALALPGRASEGVFFRIVSKADSVSNCVNARNLAR